MSKEVFILERIVTLISILVYIFSGGVSNLDNGSAFATESEEKHSDKVLIESTRTLTNKIENKLKEQNLDITSIGISIQGEEIYIQVNGTPQYVNKIEKSIKKDIKELAQQTIFQDYSIGVYMQIINANRLALEQNELVTKIQENFKVGGYEEVKNVRVEKQSKNLIVDVETSIQKNDSTSIHRGKELEKEVRKSLTEVMSPLMVEKIGVNVYNINHKKIN